MSSLNDIMQSHEMKRPTDLKLVASRLIDASALIGHVFKELSFKRRESIRPFLHNDFKEACSRNNKVESLLLGTDLAGKAQQIKNASKVMQNVTAPDRFNNNGSPHSQYASGNTQNHSQRRFYLSGGGNSILPGEI